MNRNAIAPLILAMLILILALLGFGLYALAYRYLSRPVVIEAFWTVGGKRVYRCSVGDVVVAQVVLASRRSSVEEVIVRVKMDIKYWFDQDYAARRFTVTLSSGETVKLEFEFSTEIPSGGRLVGYYMEVGLESWVGKWAMPKSYPPRLTVSS